MSDQELIEDGKRWRALDLATGVGGRACASCEMVNDETEVDPMTCAVVPWDVMGDSRSFAFVCDGCAAAVNEYDARDHVETKRYCEECNYELDDAYKDSETLCGACVNVAESVARAGESKTRSYLCEYIVRVTVTATDEDEALKLAAAELRDYEASGDLANECELWEINELDEDELDEDGEE